MIFDWMGYFGDSTIANWDGRKNLEPIGHPVRLHLEYDYSAKAPAPTWQDYFNAWLATDEPAKTTGLVIGRWWHDSPEDNDIDLVLEGIVNARERLPLLKALFVGDFTYDEWEISWIIQGDYAAVLAAYPQLEYLAIRGGSNLSFGAIHHQQLKGLVIQTGGLPVQVVRDVAAANLPALEHLELWLGNDEYGGNSTVDDLQPILSGEQFPSLINLGLRDCEYADALAQAVAKAPILERIKVLDLSLGNMSDAGAEVLFTSEAIRKLEFLDLHHHYMSDGMRDCWATIDLKSDVSGQETADEDGDEEYRYIAVSE
ncbi:STM4015 family protein [Herpetosiphon llansteffanensis]